MSNFCNQFVLITLATNSLRSSFQIENKSVLFVHLLVCFISYLYRIVEREDLNFKRYVFKGTMSSSNLPYTDYQPGLLIVTHVKTYDIMYLEVS